MTKLKKFNTESEYETFKGSSDFVTPSVSLIGKTDVRYNIPTPPAVA